MCEEKGGWDRHTLQGMHSHRQGSTKERKKDRGKKKTRYGSRLISFFFDSKHKRRRGEAQRDRDTEAQRERRKEGRKEGRRKGSVDG